MSVFKPGNWFSNAKRVLDAIQNISSDGSKFSGDVLDESERTIIDTSEAWAYIDTIFDAPGGINGIQLYGRGGISISTTNDAPVTGSITIRNPGGGGKILLVDLPTSDPLVENALWNNSGVLTISAG